MGIKRGESERICGRNGEIHVRTGEFGETLEGFGVRFEWVMRRRVVSRGRECHRRERKLQQG